MSSSPGLSRTLDGPGGGGGSRGGRRVVGGSGGGRGGPGAGAVPSTGRGGGRGEEVRDKGRGEQVRERGSGSESGEHVRDGGVGVEGREMDGGGERLLQRTHCSLFSFLLMAMGTWMEISEAMDFDKYQNKSSNLIAVVHYGYCNVIDSRLQGGISIWSFPCWFYLCICRAVQVSSDCG